MSREIVSMGSESRPPVLVMGEYAQWKLRMIHFLDQLDRNLMKSIREGPVRPTVTVVEVPETDTYPLLPSYTVEKPYHLYNQEQRARHEIDKRAMSLLIMSLPNDMYSRVDSFDNARDIWNEIEQQMQGGDTASEFQKESAMNAYEGFHAREGEQLHDSYQRLNSLVNDLRRLKVEKSRYEVNVKFLKNLNPEWRNLAINIQLSRNLGHMGLHDLFSMMVQHEEYITGNKPRKAIDPLALAAVHHGGSNLPVNPYPEEHYQDYHYDVSQDYYQHSDNFNDPTIITVTDEELHNMNESLALISHKMQRLTANRGFNRSSSHGGNRFGPGRSGHQSFDQGRGHYSQGGRYQPSDRGRGGQGRFGNNFRRDNTYLDYQESSGNGNNYQRNYQGSGYNQHGSNYNHQGSGYGQTFSGQGYEGKNGAGYDDGRFNHHSGSFEQGRIGGADQHNHGGNFNGGSHPKQPPHGKGVQISEQQSGTSSTQVQNPQPMSSSQGKTNGHGPTCFKCGAPGHYAKDCKAVYKDAAYFEKKAALMRKKEKGVALLVDEENWVCEEESSDEEDHMVSGPCLMADFEAPDSSNTEVVDFDAETGLQYNNDAFEVSSTPDISDCTSMLESKICALENELQSERILVTKFRTDSAVYKSSYEDLLISYNSETLESSIRETYLVNKLLSLNTSHDELKSSYGELELKFKLLSKERTKLFSKIKELEDNNLKRGQSEQTLHILTAHANNNPFYHAKPGLGHSDKNILDKAPSHLYTFENMSASKPKPDFVGGLTTEEFVRQSVTFSEVINGEIITRTTSLSDNTSNSPPTSPTPIGPIFTPAKDPRNTNSDWESIKARTPKVAMPPIDYSNLNSSYDSREMEFSEDVLVIPPKDVSATKSPDLVNLEKEIFELRLKAMDLDACQHQIRSNRTYFISPTGFIIHHKTPPFIVPNELGVLEWVEIEDKVDHHHLHYDRLFSVDLNLVPILQNTRMHPVGSVNGLIFLWHCFREVNYTYICNPVTREYMILPGQRFQTDGFVALACGLGVSSLGGNKVVQTFQWKPARLQRRIVLEAYVYTLGTGKWRSLSPVPVTYWLNSHHRLNGLFLNNHCQRIVRDFEDTHQKIATFDFDKETFQFLPPPPPVKVNHGLSLGILKGCLCKLDTYYSQLTIWMMKEYGIKNSWHKEMVITRKISMDLPWPYNPVQIAVLVSEYKLWVFHPRSQTTEDTKMFFDLGLSGCAYRPSFLKL
ncbi:hypothetical protein OSB04_015819 [Centaurea solstitialis]|uniref:CCHC-type domain-containing protein n=1 Tax=Centaurea solstitialis TaxID=347529 RepID=A0AA38SZR9_9ASTR|nr:hypothetical protein OSB04_015819 [Centaurea solstitialis]